MKHTFLPLLLALLLFTGCTAVTEAETETKTEATTVDTDGQPAPDAAGTYRSVSMEEAEAMMASSEDYILLDVRRPDEFAAGHIPGAINIPNETIGTSEIAALPDPGQLIFVYCRSGRRSKEASEKLAALGYTSIVEIGGIQDWPGETTQ